MPEVAFLGTVAKNEQYYFHPDHLGSSNYITNIAGEVSQHTEYFAFGVIDEGDSSKPKKPIKTMR